MYALSIPQPYADAAVRQSHRICAVEDVPDDVGADTWIALHARNTFAFKSSVWEEQIDAFERLHPLCHELPQHYQTSILLAVARIALVSKGKEVPVWFRNAWTGDTWGILVVCIEDVVPLSRPVSFDVERTQWIDLPPQIVTELREQFRAARLIKPKVSEPQAEKREEIKPSPLTPSSPIPSTNTPGRMNQPSNIITLPRPPLVDMAWVEGFTHQHPFVRRFALEARSLWTDGVLFDVEQRLAWVRSEWHTARRLYFDLGMDEIARGVAIRRIWSCLWAMAGGGTHGEDFAHAHTRATVGVRRSIQSFSELTHSEEVVA